MGIKGRGCHPRHWYTYLSMFVLYETEKDERGTFHFFLKMNAICYTVFLFGQRARNL